MQPGEPNSADRFGDWLLEQDSSVADTVYWFLGFGDFPARWHCGNWDDNLGWTIICSEWLIFLSYVVIPLALASMIVSIQKLVAVRGIAGMRILRGALGGMARPAAFWTIAFIFTCGADHLFRTGLFWIPFYRLSAIWRAIAALISVGAAAAIVEVARSLRILVLGVSK